MEGVTPAVPAVLHEGLEEGDRRRLATLDLMLQPARQPGRVGEAGARGEKVGDLEVRIGSRPRATEGLGDQLTAEAQRCVALLPLEGGDGSLPASRGVRRRRRPRPVPDETAVYAL